MTHTAAGGSRPLTSIRAKLLLQTVTAVVVVAVLGAASAIWVTVSDHRERAERQLTVHVRQFAGELDGVFAAIDGALQAEVRNQDIVTKVQALAELADLALGASVHDLSRTTLVHLIQHLHQTGHHRSFDQAAFYGPAGLAAYAGSTGIHLVTRNDGGRLVHLMPKSPMAWVRFDDFLWTETVPGPIATALPDVAPAPGITLARRGAAVFVEGAQRLSIRLDDVEGYGTREVVGGTILFRKRIDDSVLRAFHARIGSPVDLFDAQGLLIASSHPEQPSAPTPDMLRHMSGGGGLTMMPRFGGTYYAKRWPYRRDGDVVAQVVAYTSQEEVIGDAWGIIMLQLGGLTIGLTLAATAALVTARLLADPITQVAGQMRDIAATRDFSRRVRVDSRDESGLLAAAFNEMVEAIQVTDAALRDAEQKYRGIFEHSAEGVFQSTADGKILIANPSLRRMLGIAPDEDLTSFGDIGVTFYACADERPRLLRLLRETGSATNHEVDLKRRDGSIFAALISARLIRTQRVGGSTEVIEGSIQDISARKEKDRAVQARAAAEAATQAKSWFLARMSHEIRTPLNAVIGLTELTLHTSLAPKQRDSLEKVRAAAQTLLALVNDILDLSKIEADKLPLRLVPFNVRDVFDRVGDIVGWRADEKGLRLALHCAPGVPDRLLGDPLRLGQVLINLASNAVKFTERGEVLVDAAPSTVEDSVVHVRFKVSDTGIGIAEDQMVGLFDAFYQADGAIDRRGEGTGLGLAISRLLVDLMGGRLRVDSVSGHGSIFHFELPFETVLQSAPSSRDVGVGRRAAVLSAWLGHAAPPSVLLVEDNPINRQVAVEMLAFLGAGVDIAADGPTGVAKACAGRYDLILMDINLPGFNGLEATRRIRRDGSADLPIVAMTAHGPPGDRDTCLAAGMNDHVVKPISAEALKQVLLRWGRRRGALADRGRPAAGDAMGLTGPLHPVDPMTAGAVSSAPIGLPDPEGVVRLISRLRRFLQDGDCEAEAAAANLCEQLAGIGCDDELAALTHAVADVEFEDALGHLGTISARLAWKPAA